MTTVRRRVKQNLERAVITIDHVLVYYKRISDVFRLHDRDQWADVIDGLAQQLLVHQKLLSELHDKM